MRSWVLVVLLAASIVAHENLISNSGFELGCGKNECVFPAGSSLENWQVENLITVTSDGIFGYSVKFNNGGSISQHVNTYPGETYSVIFKTAQPQNASENSVFVSAHGGTPDVYEADFSISFHHYTFTATLKRTKLTFTGSPNNQNGLIDAIKCFHHDFNQVAPSEDKNDISSVHKRAIPSVKLSTTALSVSESSSVNLTILLSAATTDLVSVSVTCADGAAVAGYDYIDFSDILYLTPGQLSTSFSVLLIDDSLDENNEDFSVSIYSENTAAAVLGFPYTTVVAITDNDPTPTVSITGGATVTESVGTVNLTVSLSAVSGRGITVNYATTSGSATAGSDFTNNTGTLTFLAGESNKTITVAILNDLVTESTENFTVTLSSPFNVILGSTSSQMIIITDDDTPATISVSGGGSFSEAVGSVVLTVSLDAAVSYDVNVSYATVNGTALAGPGLDYTAVSGTLTFTAGQISKTVSVSIFNDNKDEDDQYFTFILSNPTNGAVLGISQANITIVDNDNPPTLSIVTTPNVTEGGIFTASFNLGAPSEKVISFTIIAVSGTAISGVDFNSLNSPITLNAGFVSGSISALTINDLLNEDDEYFLVAVTDAVNCIPPTSNNTIIILDNDNPPTINISQSATSVVEGAGSVSINVTLSAASGKQITVDYATSSGTATSNADFTSTIGTLIIAAGKSSANITVPILQDSLDENTETFNLTLSNPVNASLSTTSNVIIVSIVDDDPTPVVSISGGTTILEEAGAVTLTVSLNTTSGKTVTVDYSTSAGTATSDVDFTSDSGTVTFLPGETDKNITISIINDNIAESNEYFTVSLSNAFNATIGTSLQTVTIADTEVPAISINDVVASESDGTAVITVSLSLVSSYDVTVNYVTASGTATSGSDFTAASGTLRFSAGETTKTINVTIIDDSLDENNEAFTVTLSNAVNGTLSTSSATITITDNDDPPTITVTSDSPTSEGDYTTFNFTLSAVSAKVITVDVATSGVTATQGVDFPAIHTTLTIPAGRTSVSAIIFTIEDSIDEPDETFTVTFSNPSNAVLGSQTSLTVTITDDDPPPTISISGGGSVAETATKADLVVSLSGPSGKTITVAYTTAPGTATEQSAGRKRSLAGDYLEASGTLTFTPGQTSKTVSVTINDDLLDENDEDFSVIISSPTNAVLGTSNQTVTIIDDDAPPPVSISSSPSVSENNGTITVQIYLELPSGKAVTVDYATASGTAISGSDFTAASGTVTFAPGDDTKNVPITITNDNIHEGNETFTVTLSNAVNASINIASVTAIIVDDDPIPTVSIWRFDRYGKRKLDYATASGTATSGSDFTAASGTLTFSAGQTSKTVNVSITDDGVSESDEDFTVTISNPSNAVLGTASQTITITDNDATPTVSVTSSSTVSEDDGSANIIVSLSAASGETITVDYATASGTAISGSDFTAASGTLTFNAGDITKTVSISITDDSISEPSQTFQFVISNPSSAVLGQATHTVTITDNDVSVISVTGPSTISESSSATTYSVQISPISEMTITVDVVAVSGTAIKVTDFADFTQQISVSPSASHTDFQISPVDDILDENDEYFTVKLQNPTNGNLGTSSLNVTLTDNDNPPTVSLVLSSTTPSEGDSSIIATAHLSEVSAKTITVSYRTSAGTATAGSDYTTVSGTLTFSPGQNDKTVTIPILDDTTDEDDETFDVILENPVNADPSGAMSAQVTILDNDVAPTVSITSSTVTVAEGDGTVTVGATLSAASAKTVTVSWTTNDIEAKQGQDYTASSGTLTFAPGTTTASTSITILQDLLDELTETFSVVLSSPTQATLTSSVTCIVSITDDDNPPSVSITAASTTVSESTSLLTANITLSAPSGKTVSVSSRFDDGTATAGQDFVSATYTVTFNPGETVLYGNVTISNDALDEDDETFTWVIFNPINAVLGHASETITITDNDPTPTLSISGGGSFAEGVGTVTLNVALDAASGKAITVNYAASGSATSGTDFTGGSGTLTFAAGDTSKSISLTITDDTLDEDDETVVITLSSPTNAVLGTSDQTVTITDNDAAPTVSISGSGTVVESAGNTSLTVSLSAASAKTITVDYATSNGAATAGSDYIAASGTLTFTAGQTSKTVTVSILPDSIDETDEDFTVTLSNPSNAALGTATKIVTITDDDGTPTADLSGGGSFAESAGSVTLTVSLSAASSQTVTVDYATSSGTATSGSDFTAASGTLTFNAGDTSKTFTVSITDDNTDENDETFTVTLTSSTNSVLGTSSQTVTITDNDAAPTVSISGSSPVSETGSASLTVSLSAASAKSITVDYATSDGAATAGSDYTATSGTLTFSAGQTSKTFTVPITADSLDESDEDFTVTISNPSNAVLGSSTKSIVITDDDASPTVSISGGASVAENVGTVTLTVSLNTASGRSVTVDYATASGTATSGSDFVAVSGTITFIAGQTSKTFTVSITDDVAVENAESFTVTISNPSNAVLGTSSQTITINANDPLPSVSLSGGGNIAENVGTITFTATLSVAAEIAVSVDYATSVGTATSADFTAASGTLNFAIGDTVKTFTVAITDDTLDENSESFTVTISNPSNAVLGTSSQTVTITDNDATPTVSISGGATVAESDGTITLTVSLSTASGLTATVNYGTVAGTATSSDYTSAFGTLTFSPGQTSKTVTIAITSDGMDENDGETFSVSLSGANNCVLGTSSQTVTINDSDAPPFAQISGGTTANEGTAVTLTVSLSAASAKTVQVNLNFTGTATEGDDYTASTSTVTFSAGQTSKSVTINILSDSEIESDETIFSALDGCSNCALGRVSVQTITIRDTTQGVCANCQFSDRAGCSVGIVQTSFDLPPSAGVSYNMQDCEEDGHVAPEVDNSLTTISINAFDSLGNRIPNFRFPRSNPLIATFTVPRGTTNWRLLMVSPGESIWRDADSTCGLQPVFGDGTVTFFICHLTTFNLISAQPERDPLLEWSFLFFCGEQSDPIVSGFFTNVHGLKNMNEWECERFTTVNGREVSSCLPSQIVTSPLVLKRILTFDDQFWNWRDVVSNGHLTEARQNCTVLLFDRSYTPAREFTFFNAWPSSIEIEPIRTMQPNQKRHTLETEPGKQAVMEVITIIHEGFTNGVEPAFFSILDP